jgi:hypothetical protein
MRGLKRLGLALASMVVLGITATSALAALPDLHVTLESKFPVSAVAESTKATTGLATAGGSVLTGTGVKTTITYTELSSLGKYVAVFTSVVKGAKKCKTGTEAAGTVKIEGELHLVYAELTPKLVVAALFLVPKTTIECEGLNVKVEGSVLGTYNGKVNSEITEFKGALLGEKGKQALTKYENDEGKVVEAVLLSEAGAGFTKSSQNVSEELTFKSAQMFEILDV